MNTALVVITLVSVGTTAVVLLYAMRLLREERERSEARVIALGDAIAASASAPAGIGLDGQMYRDQAPARSPWPPRANQVERRTLVAPDRRHQMDGMTPVPPSDRRQMEGGTSVPLDNSTTPERFPNASREITDLRITPLEPFDRTDTAEAPLLFGAEPEGTSRSRTPLLALVAGAIVVLAVLGGIYVTSSRPSWSTAAAPAAAAATQTPLELVSLRHARKGDGLTISGLVRNPLDGQRQAGVTAVVFLFDRNGTFITSGRAPLDYRQLAAGDESPFVVTVPKAGAVTRYRVSFRTERDVMPHIDRRAGPLGTGTPQ